MKTPVSRAWRFLHPDFDPPGGLALSPTGRVELVAGEGAVRQALRILLSTSPGERVMRPEYGCNLRALVYSLNDDSTAGLAIHHIRQAVTRWEPRVLLLDVDARRDELRPNFLLIRVRYRLRLNRQEDELNFGLNLLDE